MDAVMIPVDVHPSEVAHFFSFLRGGEIVPGCIVTIPHKQESFRLVGRTLLSCA